MNSDNIEHQQVEDIKKDINEVNDKQLQSKDDDDIKSNECERESKEECHNENEEETADNHKDTKSDKASSSHSEKRPHKDTDRYQIHVNEQSSMRKQISFAIYALKEGQTISISGFGVNAERAVRMAEIIKLRIGMLHQDTTIITNTVKFNDNRQAESTGILVKLSKRTLDTKSAGYQKPKPIDETLLPQPRNQFQGSLRNRERLPKRFSDENFNQRNMINGGGQRFGGRSPFRDFNHDKYPRFNHQLPLSRNQNGPRTFGYQNREGINNDFANKGFGTQRSYPRRNDGRFEGRRDNNFRDFDTRPRENRIPGEKPFNSNRRGTGRFYDTTTTNEERRTQQPLRPRPLGSMRGGLLRV